MSLRIITGQYKGRKLRTPDVTTTHPMGDRVRVALFNIIGDEIKDAEVLDAFAGSGSLGFEALSRGAKNVTFVENNVNAKKALVENITTLSVSDRAKIEFMAVDRYINTKSSGYYDIILVDPPYDDMQLSTVSRLAGLLKPKGLMVLSYPGKGGAPAVDGIVVVDNRGYGKAQLAFYQKK